MFMFLDMFRMWRKQLEEMKILLPCSGLAEILGENEDEKPLLKHGMILDTTG